MGEEEVMANLEGQLYEVHARAAAPAPAPSGDPLAYVESSVLTEALLGHRHPSTELPSLADLGGALIDLSENRRAKITLPLSYTPAEFALVRDGEHVLVSCYDLEAATHVYVLDRPVSLSGLLHACAQQALQLADHCQQSDERVFYLSLAERLGQVRVHPHTSETHFGGSPVVRSGGATSAPADEAPLAFGFTARIRPGTASSGVVEHSERADVHATLFTGQLWSYVRGKKIELVRGPIWLAVQRMVQALHAMLPAWEEGRAAYTKLRAGSFSVAFRLEPSGEVALTLGSEEAGSITIPALSMNDATRPVLRLATDLIRTMVQCDVQQSKNLRVTALGEEVQGIRRRIQARKQIDNIINHNAERHRWWSTSEWSRASIQAVASLGGGTRPASVSMATSTQRLRFAERWRHQIEGLQSCGTYLCGDRLVVATPHETTALSRADGSVLWSHPAHTVFSTMTGTALLRVAPSGDVELCDVRDGEMYAAHRMTSKYGTRVIGVVGGGADLPPLAILEDGKEHILAVDVRNGQARWRFGRPGASSFQVRRSGRMLLVVSGDASVHALDIVSGEIVWRFVERATFATEPAVVRDMAVVVSGDPHRNGASSGTEGLYGIDVFSGALRWSTELRGAPSHAPIATDERVLVPHRIAEQSWVSAIHPSDGQTLWTVPDPGLADGGASLAVDQRWLVNAPSGHLTAIGLQDGVLNWQNVLHARPTSEDLPRRLDPILRLGALFVPSAQAHVVSPSDGSTLQGALPCDLIPDFLRVDERGWVFVAEESGHLRAYAPVPYLQLVR
jgi:outer membrane protein assembly factor BamB